jgi:molybdopterin-guanine dinucleotide biosynthesis protein A
MSNSGVAQARKTSYCAVVLAGERPGGSPLSRTLGLKASVLVDVAGKSALQRVMEALSGSKEVSGGLLCGPASEVYEQTPDFRRILDESPFHWLEPEAGPSASAIKAIKAIDHFPVLLTTGDHALLTPELVDSFCQQARAAGGDVVAGLAPYSIVHAAYPESKRTVQRYSDGGFCGTNLFVVQNPAGLAALEFWKSVEAERKRPWKIAQKLGFMFLLRAALRKVSLQQTFEQLSKRSGCRVAYVLVNSARAAVDVDSVADRDLAQSILLNEGGA